MPTRTCKSTRQSAEKSALLRFVAAPDGSVVLDLAHKLPGRGLNLSPTRAAYNKAVQQKLFSRELGSTAPPPAWEDILHALAQDAMGRLGLAKKAGQAHPGWDAIRHAKNLCGIVLAEDAGSDIAARVETHGVPVARPATAAELAAALGLPNVGAVGISAHHAWQALQKLAQARKEDLIEKGKPNAI